jgi:hypothetical protein
MQFLKIVRQKRKYGFLDHPVIILTRDFPMLVHRGFQIHARHDYVDVHPSDYESNFGTSFLHVKSNKVSSMSLLSKTTTPSKSLQQIQIGLVAMESSRPVEVL